MVTLDEFLAWEEGEFSRPFRAARGKKPGFDPQQENEIDVDVEVVWPGRFGARTFPAHILTIPLEKYLAGIDGFYQRYQSGEFGRSLSLNQRQNIRDRYEYKIGNEISRLSEEELVNIAFDEALNVHIPLSYHRRNWWQEIFIFLPGDYFEQFRDQLRAQLPAELGIGEELQEKRWFNDSKVDYRFYTLSYEKQYSRQQGMWGSGEVRRLFPVEFNIRPDWPNLVRIVWHGGGRGCANLIKSVAKVVQEQQYEAIFSVFRNEYDVASHLKRVSIFDRVRMDPNLETIGGVFYKPRASGGS